MSFESHVHEQLVRRIVQEVAQRHGGLYSLAIYADLKEFGRNKPDRVGGFVPDVLAHDCPETCRVIGEAKTPLDFETPRSRRQIGAFLTHLAGHSNSYFYLAIPWRHAARAALVLHDIAAETGSTGVAIEILRDL